MKEYDLDEVFSDLVRDERGQAVMSVKGASQQLDVLLGPNYRAVVIYAPKPAVPQAGAAGGVPNGNFVGLEPVAGIINALNLAHRGEYKELRSIPPSGIWEESFWIRPIRFENTPELSAPSGP